MPFAAALASRSGLGGSFAQKQRELWPQRIRSGLECAGAGEDELRLDLAENDEVSTRLRYGNGQSARAVASAGFGVGYGSREPLLGEGPLSANGAALYLEHGDDEFCGQGKAP